MRERKKRDGEKEREREGDTEKQREGENMASLKQNTMQEINIQRYCIKHIKMKSLLLEVKDK